MVYSMVLCCFIRDKVDTESRIAANLFLPAGADF